MSVALRDEIERNKRLLAEEKNKPAAQRDDVLIANLQTVIKEEEARLQAEKAEAVRTVQEGKPITQEEKDAALISGAVKSASVFLKTAEVKQIHSTSQALSGDGQVVDENGNKRNVESKDIDKMNANARKVAGNEQHQEEHKQRQEAAKLLKQQLANPNLSPEERTKKEKELNTITEAVNEFQTGEKALRQQTVLQSLKQKTPRVEHGVTNSPEQENRPLPDVPNNRPPLRKVEQVPTRTPEQEKERQKELFRLEQELEKGKISPEQYVQGVEKANNPVQAEAGRKFVERNEGTRQMVGGMLGLNSDPSKVTEQQRENARRTSAALGGLQQNLQSAGMTGGAEAAGIQSTVGTPAQQQTTSKGPQR